MKQKETFTPHSKPKQCTSDKAPSRVYHFELSFAKREGVVPL